MGTEERERDGGERAADLDGVRRVEADCVRRCFKRKLPSCGALRHVAEAPSTV